MAQPAISGKTEKQIGALLTCLAGLMRRTDEEYDKTDSWDKYNQAKTEGDHDYPPESTSLEVYGAKKCPLPECLEERSLTDGERERVLAACVKELTDDPCLKVVNDLIDVCRLLKKPENHIKVPSWQYVEVETSLRTEADMVAEKIRGDNRTAKVYSLCESLWSGVWKGKIRTRVLPAPAIANNSGLLLEHNSLKYQRERSEIREEMQKRQQSWRKDKEPPPVHS